MEPRSSGDARRWPRRLKARSGRLVTAGFVAASILTIPIPAQTPGHSAFSASTDTATAWAAAAEPRARELRVSVLEAPYDAAGDGVTNDRAAIQRAIEDVADSGGGTVVLPESRVFLTGNLRLRNKVTLEINGTVEQSQAADDYTYDPVPGHVLPDSPRAYVTWYHNHPLIYAGHAKDVAVTGTGSILMTSVKQADGSNDDQHTIHVLPIGYYQVDGFEISGISILRSNTYHLAVYWSANGVIDNVTLDVCPTQPCDHDTRNTDGIQIKNSRDIQVTDNRLEVHDDAIVVGVSHDDPRDGTWWKSDIAQGISNIEITRNYVTGPGGRGRIAFIPWGTKAADPSTVETSDIRIHHNEFATRYEGVHLRMNNPYDPSPSGPDDISPVKNIEIRDNVVHLPEGDKIGLRYWQPLHHALISNLRGDLGVPSNREIHNGDFGDHGTAYWSVVGDAGAVGPDASDLDNQAVRQAAAEQAQTWGWFGYVQGGDSALYQGLGLSDGVPYRFAADVRTSGDPTQLYARNSCTGQTVGTLEVNGTRSRRAELAFRAVGTCSSYEVGVRRRGGTDDGWALFDNAVLQRSVEVLDDTAAEYRGSWSTWHPEPIKGRPANRVDHDWKAVGHLYSGATEADAGARFQFSGTRAWLTGFRWFDGGQAAVYVDGTYRGTVDFYHRFARNEVVFDTGVLTPGTHTVELVNTGTKHPSSGATWTTVDALLVETATGG